MIWTDQASLFFFFLPPTLSPCFSLLFVVHLDFSERVLTLEKVLDNLQREYNQLKGKLGLLGTNKVDESHGDEIRPSIPLLDAETVTSQRYISLEDV